MTLIGLRQLCDAAEARSEQSFIGGSLLSVIPEKDRATGFQFGHKLGNSTKTELRHDFTVKADGLRPAVQIEKGTVGAELFDIPKDGDQQIQVLTKEGVHVAGTSALTPPRPMLLCLLTRGLGQDHTAALI